MATPASSPSPATVALHAFVAEHSSHPHPESFRPKLLEWLEQGADLNYPSLDASQEAGYPLALACAAGSSEWVQVLLDLGARLDAAPCQEDLENDQLMPATPFSPLGRIVNYLAYELEDDGEGLRDHSRGAVKIVGMLLARGADPLEPDPFMGVRPLTDWAREVGERLDGGDLVGLSSPQVETVLAVTDALVGALPDPAAHAIKKAVLEGEVAPGLPFVRDFLNWPSPLLGAWRSRELARIQEDVLPRAASVKRPGRF